MPESPPRSLGRNDPCHCGSGKKYKQCCLAKDQEAEREARAKAATEAPAAEGGPARPIPRAPKHTTRQPWKATQNTRGFQRANLPRRSGSS